MGVLLVLNLVWYFAAIGDLIYGIYFTFYVPVWFNADDVAAGVDPVVQSAINWMDKLVFSHDVTLSRNYVAPGAENLGFAGRWQGR